MRHLIHLVLLLACAAPEGSAAQAAATTGTDTPAMRDNVEAGRLRVELSGMKSDAGSLIYALWSGPENWLKRDPLREGSVTISNGASLVVIDELPYGEYALSAYHDANDNAKLDTGMFGIPKEPLGISKNARSRFGPPKYKDARFLLEEPSLTIAIIVKKLF